MPQPKCCPTKFVIRQLIFGETNGEIEVTNRELREDGGIELREDNSEELREN